MNKHTPGPWVLEWPKEDDCSSEINIVGVDGSVLAFLSPSECTNPEKFEADASLIAAAPELLQALREMLRVMPLDAINVSAAIRQARAAIAKATEE